MYGFYWCELSTARDKVNNTQGWQTVTKELVQSLSAQ